MAEKTIERRENETEARQWTPERKVSKCFCCKKKFVEGDTIYIIKNNAFMGRHTTCARRAEFKKSPETEEEHLQAARDKRQLGPDKRQRTAGHGYSGGNGFKGLKTSGGSGL